VDKQGAEFYQVTLGGTVGPDAARTAIGGVIGRAFAAAEIPGVVATILDQYVALREDGERFIDTYARVGMAPFKAAVYPAHDPAVELQNA
jgi:sulfite reductase (NADPH) hemoprotein beta-component